MPPSLTSRIADQAAPAVVLDGGLATRLEARGNDLSSHLWSARLLLDDPAEVREAHRDFLEAGAEVVTTASYQVSYEGFATARLGAAETDRLLRLSVSTARQAVASMGESTAKSAAESRLEPEGEQSVAGAARWVAASVGPYGASLADGSEYRGDYGLPVARLREWHRRRLQVLVEAEPDVIALETVPCLAEAEALLAEVQGSGMPCWLSLTTVADRTRLGEPVAEAFAMARDVPEVVAVGVNCCAPRGLADVAELARATSGKPAVVYPNSGEGWKAGARQWDGRRDFDPREAAEWVASGARLVGGCCRVTPSDIRVIADVLR